MLEADSVDYESAGLLHEQFIRQARLTPLNTAVVDENEGCLTYKELDELTEKLALVLQVQGVRENRIVAIYMDKCVQYVVAYIAVLRAGGAYLPLDVSYPGPLLHDILEEAEPLVVLTKTGLAARLPEQCRSSGRPGFATVCLNEHVYRDEIIRLSRSHVDQCVSHVDTNSLSFESLAFVVYSSGTTGKPKGIRVPLRAPVLSYWSRHRAYPYHTGSKEGGDDNGDREAANVFFVWELLRPLLKGQTLFIVPDDTIYDPNKLLDFLFRNRITRMLFTPSLLETVLDFPLENVNRGFQSMRHIWLCGEVTTTTMIERALRVLPHVRFINLYSISECHDVADIDLTDFYREQPQKLRTTKFTPVGCLLPLVKVAILDEHMKILPVGAPGEIYVYGPSLALGYLNKPDLTDKKFVTLLPDLTSGKGAGEKMYKTGDWGYLLSNGSLEIAGRCDAMVKIRGYSVEMAAIENVLTDLPFVQSCVVITHGDEGEDKSLIAYIVPKEPVTVKTVRGELKRRLPFYMIPSYFAFLKEIPILPVSGKLNKKALPTLDELLLQNLPEYLPETETERLLSEIWSSVLQISAIDVQESFFDLGGHSLLAAKLLQIVSEKLNVKISVKDFYSNPTIFQMAKLLDQSPVDTKVEINLLQEVELHSQYDADFDIQLRAFWRFSSFNKTRWPSARVLLTGATGYLGAFMLAELIKSTESHIFCLIRENVSGSNSNHEMDIQERFLNTIQKYFLFDTVENLGGRSPDPEALIRERITFVKGDVSIVNFGLTDNDYRYLSTEIDYIIHAAAYVNLVYPYSALYSSNVLGTCNIIKFASASKIKPLHYISSDAVFPHNFVGTEESDLTDCWTSLTTGYSQTKWVAEQIVQRMLQKGHPVIIYRLGNQSPDTVNGAVNLEDFNFMMIRSFLYLKVVPDIDWKLEMTPVDFSAKLVVKMAKLLPEHVGKIYHLINPKSVPLNSLSSWLHVQRFKSDVVPYEEYLNRLKTSKIEMLAKLFYMLSEGAPSGEYFTLLNCHDSSYTRSVLAKDHVHYPKITFDYFKMVLTKNVDRGIIPRPLASENTYKMFYENNLVGKVAFITGASSGIGREIAIELSNCGCSVALIARSEDLLKRLASEIINNGGQVYTMKTDVSNQTQVDLAVSAVEKNFGPIDILVNCAGVMFYQDGACPRLADCDTMIDVNIKGLVYCTTAVLRSMTARKSGHIVQISSDAGRGGFPGMAVYAGTKHFVEGYSRSLRQELAPSNIRVTSIQPGDVRTPLQEAALVGAEGAERFCTVTDTSVILEPRDVARTVLFALSAPPHVAVNELLVEPTTTPI